ncbi:hypothetical protein ABZW18_07415 [Streptomyces sp. NPDC004647]|uniref:hypothetical protein n=1 Tax=Streptomyces sp. NPDC004647 TaxID=3154671 RepID=UPI0033B9372C
MAVLVAVLMPIAMLGVVLALGRYEELMLTPSAPHGRPDRRLIRVHRFARRFTAHEGGEER